MRTERKKQFTTDSCPPEVSTREIPKVKEQQTQGICQDSFHVDACLVVDR